MKAFLDIFKIVPCDSYVLSIPCSVVGGLDPMMIFIPKAFGTLPVDHFTGCPRRKGTDFIIASAKDLA